MTAVETWRRRPTSVRTMRLDTPADLACALVWLNGHHVSATLAWDELVIWTGQDRDTARIGQVIVIAEGGAVEVHDAAAFGPDGEFEK